MTSAAKSLTRSTTTVKTFVGGVEMDFDMLGYDTEADLHEPAYYERKKEIKENELILDNSRPCPID